MPVAFRKAIFRGQLVWPSREVAGRPKVGRVPASASSCERYTLSGSEAVWPSSFVIKHTVLFSSFVIAKSLFATIRVMRVLVYGDSITQGYWDTEGGWVDRLRRHFDELKVADLDGGDQPSVLNLGISADNSDNILLRIEQETRVRTRHNRPPIVIVQIGVNDSSIDKSGNSHTVSVSAQQYEQNLRHIISKVKAMGSNLIFVGLTSCDESKTTPVSWGEFYYTNEAIKQYEDIMEKVAAENNVPFVPVFDEFANATKEGLQFLPDGLHPNNQGHELILKIVLPKLAPLLAE